MRTLHAALWWGSPPFKNLLLFLSPAGPGKLGLAWPTRGPHGRGHGAESRGCRASPGEMGAEAPSARREAGRRQASPGGGKKGPKLEGWRELAPHQLASCEAERITGKELGQAEMSGPQEQADGGGGDVGHGCWGPGDAGRGLGCAPPPQHTTTPRPPWGGKRLLGRQGPRVPHPHPQGVRARAGDHPAQPSRWLGWRPAGPSLAPQPDTGESGTASSVFPEEAASQAGFPACKSASGSLQSWRRPNALIFQTDRIFPFSPRPCDTSFPHPPKNILSSGFPQAEMRPPGDQEANSEDSLRSTVPPPSNLLHLYPLRMFPENLL